MEALVYRELESFGETQPNAIFGHNWADLTDIHSPSINLAVFQRQPFAIEDVHAELSTGNFKSFQFTLERKDDSAIVGAALDEDLDLKCEGAYGFYMDIVRLTDDFFRLSRANEVGIRLEMIDNDACGLFHVDRVTLRLVTTFGGPATEWLKNEDVLRGGLFKQDNKLVLRTSAEIQKLAPFEVGIMKGEKYFGNEGRGLVHRSPPLSGSGKKRILLRMDSLS